MLLVIGMDDGDGDKEDDDEVGKVLDSAGDCIFFLAFFI
jgi:hypothetical protein